MSKVGEYIKETRSELKHVSWPTKRQAIAFTVIVIAISVLTAAFLGTFDFIFTKAVGLLIELATN